MSFSKAEQLIELATLAASRHMGITLDDVVDAFPGSTRTAQRMMRALENRFPETEAFFGDDGRKRWRLRSAALRDLMTLTAEETAALELAVKALGRSGNSIEANHLKSLKQKILALVPRSQVARLETDHEALLEAQGLATRPGPRPLVVPEIASAVAEAIKACRVLEIVYRSRGGQKPKPRRVRTIVGSRHPLALECIAKRTTHAIPRRCHTAERRGSAAPAHQRHGADRRRSWRAPRSSDMTGSEVSLRPASTPRPPPFRRS